MHLNTLLDIMAMILLDHYVQGFQIWLVILEKLMKIKIKKKNTLTRTMSLKVNDKQLLKNHDKIWENIERLMNIDFESKHTYGDDDKL